MSSTTNTLQVRHFVRPFNEDGHTFIHHAADSILNLTSTHQNTVSIPAKRIFNAKATDPTLPPTILTIPQTISHFVMNLPATAIDFLGSSTAYTKATNSSSSRIRVRNCQWCMSIASRRRVKIMWEKELRSVRGYQRNLGMWWNQGIKSWLFMKWGMWRRRSGCFVRVLDYLVKWLLGRGEQDEVCLAQDRNFCILIWLSIKNKMHR